MMWGGSGPSWWSVVVQHLALGGLRAGGVLDTGLVSVSLIKEVVGGVGPGVGI